LAYREIAAEETATPFSEAGCRIKFQLAAWLINWSAHGDQKQSGRTNHEIEH
jgi:hypothetical protein